MTGLWRLLTSLKTCAWTSLAFAPAGAAGSVVIGRYPEISSDMDAQVFAALFTAANALYLLPARRVDA